MFQRVCFKGFPSFSGDYDNSRMNSYTEILKTNLCQGFFRSGSLVKTTSIRTFENVF